MPDRSASLMASMPGKSGHLHTGRLATVWDGLTLVGVAGHLDVGPDLDGLLGELLLNVLQEGRLGLLVQTALVQQGRVLNGLKIESVIFCSAQRVKKVV